MQVYDPLLQSNRQGILEQISVGCWLLLAISSGKTLQVVLEVLLRAEATSHAENVRWHDLGMQLNIVPRAMPEIARGTEFVMHLCGLCRRQPQRIELALDPATVHMVGTQVHHHKHDIGPVCSTLAIAEDLRIIHRMKVQALSAMEGWILPPDPIHPRNKIL